MADRTVYGLNFSENGWRMVDQGSCVWVKVPGTDVTLQIREGQPAKIMGAFAADFNAYVEPLRDADSACWTATNSVASSNHLSGTAMDLNWNSHPFRVADAGFDAAKKATVTELLNWYEDTIFWGNDWDSPKDAMHFQMDYDTYGSENVARVQRFIDTKIRADGFSTFRRGGTVTPPPPPSLSKKDQYVVQVIQEGQRRGITPRGIQIALATCLVESNLTMYANARVPESMNIPHEAVGSDAYSVGLFQQQVRDTGNGWWWGDAATCMDPTLSAGLFYDRLGRLDYNGSNSPGSYAQAVQASAFPDRYDQRFAEAVQIYNRLSAPSGDDLLSALTPDEQREVLTYLRWAFAPDTGEFRKEFPSRSAVRDVNEGTVDTISGMELNTDGNVDFLATFLRAQLRYPPALERLQRVAAGDEPGRSADDALLAQAILAEVTSTKDGDQQ